MEKINFWPAINSRLMQGKVVCVGLDPVAEKLPPCLGGRGPRQVSHFTAEIVKATHDIALGYKPNLAFYLAFGIQGLQALFETIQAIRYADPTIPIILDAKWADIGPTNKGYVHFAFEELGVDAVTLSPYLGREALSPFLERDDKGLIILCKTSNPGAAEFQDRLALVTTAEAYEFQDCYPQQSERIKSMLHKYAVAYLGYLVRNYQLVAMRVATKWNGLNNCGIVVGATYPVEAENVRILAPDLPFLVPGFGKQGGRPEDVVPVVQYQDGGGFISNSSSGITQASAGEDYAEAARAATQKLTAEINCYRSTPNSVEAKP